MWHEVYRDGETVIYQVDRGRSSDRLDSCGIASPRYSVGWLFQLPSVCIPALPDRGYISQPDPGIADLGVICSGCLLRWGYFPSTMVGLLFSGGLLIFCGSGHLRAYIRSEFSAWLGSQKRMVVASEVLFLVSFAAWAVVRAANPEAIGTEKPMELAFINAILRSRTFPPHDPWLSGYAISYYYFGYVIVAMLAKITGTAGGIAFNLGISLDFCLECLRRIRAGLQPLECT